MGLTIVILLQLLTFILDEVICGGDDKVLHRWERSTSHKILEGYKVKEAINKIDVNPMYDMFTTIDIHGHLDVWLPSVRKSMSS